MPPVTTNFKNHPHFTAARAQAQPFVVSSSLDQQLDRPTVSFPF